MYIIYEIAHRRLSLNYIGISCDIVHRMYVHSARARNEDRSELLYKAIREYGPENFKVTVIGKCRSLKRARELEKQYIQERKACLNIHHRYVQ